MLVKSVVTVALNVSADAERLDDGTIVLSRARLVRDAGMESAADFLVLPEDVRRAALNALALDARTFIADMEMAGVLGVKAA